MDGQLVSGEIPAKAIKSLAWKPQCPVMITRCMSGNLCGPHGTSMHLWLVEDGMFMQVLLHKSLQQTGCCHCYCGYSVKQ